jgi:5,5'-dehydrodivanillate O-demethylase
MITKEENERLTRVGPGSPAGELLRRYWWPVAFGDELKGSRPKRVRLLGEDFILFRDGSSKVGMLELFCAHRRTSLENGRVEKDGIRCCYHGWLYSAEGRCLEQPCELPESGFKDKVSMKAYPTQEAGGLVFVYIGPGPAPLLPKYDLLVHNSGTRYVWGFTDHCNWLQSAENAADMSHLSWLHAGPYPMYANKRSRIEYVRRDYGFDYLVQVPGLPAENCVSLIFPSGNRFASGRSEQAMGARQNMLIRVPQDDTKSLNFFITLYPTYDGKLVQKMEAPPEQSERGPWIPTERCVYPSGDEDWWRVESMMQDRMAIEGQGVITDRSTEHLAASDRGVVLYREMLRESIRAVESGRDPVGVIRDPAQNPPVEFGTHLHTIAPALRLKEPATAS